MGGKAARERRNLSRLQNGVSTTQNDDDLVTYNTAQRRRHVGSDAPPFMKNDYSSNTKMEKRSTTPFKNNRDGADATKANIPKSRLLNQLKSASTLHKKSKKPKHLKRKLEQLQQHDNESAVQIRLQLEAQLQRLAEEKSKRSAAFEPKNRLLTGEIFKSEIIQPIQRRGGKSLEKPLQVSREADTTEVKKKSSFETIVNETTGVPQRNDPKVSTNHLSEKDQNHSIAIITAVFDQDPPFHEGKDSKAENDRLGCDKLVSSHDDRNDNSQHKKAHTAHTTPDDNASTNGTGNTTNTHNDDGNGKQKDVSSLPASNSDSDDDVDLTLTKKTRTRGRRRGKGRQEVGTARVLLDKESKRDRLDLTAAEQETPNKAVALDDTRKTKEIEGSPFAAAVSEEASKSGAKRRCIGRRPVTDFQIGNTYDGKVVYLKPFGAFVDIGSHSDAFCHISCVSDQYVTSIESLLQVGQSVNARVLEVDRRTKRISVALNSNLEDNGKTQRNERKRKENETIDVDCDTKRSLKIANIVIDNLSQSNAKTDIVTSTNEKKEKLSILPRNDSNVCASEEPSTAFETYAEMKRARKIARRAMRRQQKEETGLAA